MGEIDELKKLVVQNARNIADLLAEMTGLCGHVPVQQQQHPESVRVCPTAGSSRAALPDMVNHNDVSVNTNVITVYQVVGEPCKEAWEVIPLCIADVSRVTRLDSV